MKLNTFESIPVKQQSFQDNDYYVIDTKERFDAWFDNVVHLKEEERTNFIFRGMKDAKHKLYTSAQRIWLENDMPDWCTKSYIGFVNDLVQKAKNYPLIRKVFDTYDYSDSKREFPILSILQHYGAPTPLMDWTHNINVALFFATEAMSGGHGTGNIDNYFSIYSIDKRLYKDELLHLLDFDPHLTTNLMSFSGWDENTRNANKNANSIFYISDFDLSNRHGAPSYPSIKIQTSKPITSVYNQNIIPQEGIFIFNPFASKTIDDIFNVKPHSEGSNLVLGQFSCFNIKKDLSNYVKRRIKNYQNIDSSFIYPQLRDDAFKITETTLNSYV